MQARIEQPVVAEIIGELPQTGVSGQSREQRLNLPIRNYLLRNIVKQNAISISGLGQPRFLRAD